MAQTALELSARWRYGGDLESDSDGGGRSGGETRAPRQKPAAPRARRRPRPRRSPSPPRQPLSGPHAHRPRTHRSYDHAQFLGAPQGGTRNTPTSVRRRRPRGQPPPKSNLPTNPTNPRTSRPSKSTHSVLQNHNLAPPSVDFNLSNT